MKTEPISESSKLARRAMRRAARKVFSDAVDAGEAIPLWDGTKVVWKIPKEEIEQMDALDGHSAALHGCK